MFTRSQAVADVVLSSPGCAQVFQRYRIDFCCRGEQTVEAAAQLRRLDVDALLLELDLAAKERTADAPDVRQLSMPEVAAFTVSHHHEPLLRTLPLVAALATKVRRVHSAHAPGLVRLEARVTELAAALRAHLSDEATLLFPSLAEGRLDAHVQALLQASISDHLAVVGLLEEIRASADDFVAPEWACTSFRTLYSQLQWLEHDVFALIHLENYVLWPRLAATGAS